MSSSPSTPDSSSDLNSDSISEEMRNLQVGFRQPEGSDPKLAWLLQFMMEQSRLEDDERRKWEQLRREDDERRKWEQLRREENERRKWEQLRREFDKRREDDERREREHRARMEKLYQEARWQTRNENLNRIPSIRVPKLSGNENRVAINRFFQIVQIEAKIRAFDTVETISLAQYNLTGKLDIWYRKIPITDWDTLQDFQEALSLECLKGADDKTCTYRFLGLQQGSKLARYISEFKGLADKVPEPYYEPMVLLDKFIQGLQEPLRTFTRLKYPGTWQEARDLAIAEDAKTRQIEWAYNKYKAHNQKKTGKTNRKSSHARKHS